MGSLAIQGQDKPSLRTKAFTLSQFGAAFTKVGTYKVLHHTNPSWEGIFIEKYDLSELEIAAKMYKNETSKLINNLNKIYRLCGQDRSLGLPFNFTKTTNASFSEILQKSEAYLQELMLFYKNSFDLKFLEDIQKEVFVAAQDDEERTYFYPAIFEHFDDMKKFLRFHFHLNVSTTEVCVNVTMTVPYAEDGDLYEITYIPVISSSGEVTFLRDQSASHLIDSHLTLRYETDLESCSFENEILLCRPKNERILSILDNEPYCLTSLYKGESRDEDSCSYVDADTDLFQLTSLGNGRFYYLLKAPKKYSYECSDGDSEIGYLRGSGVLTLEPECSLTTAFESIFYDGEVADLTIFIRDEFNEADIYGISLIVIMVAIVAILLMAVYIKLKICINRQNMYKYVHFQREV